MTVHNAVIGILLVLLAVILLSIESKAEVKVRTFTSQENAAIYLDYEMSNWTNHRTGKWLIGHTEKFADPHGFWPISASDDYIMNIAKTETVIEESFTCAVSGVLLVDRKSGLKNAMDAKICVSKDLTIISIFGTAINRLPE